VLNVPGRIEQKSLRRGLNVLQDIRARRRRHEFHARRFPRSRIDGTVSLAQSARCEEKRE
jgi:hypothetical protein